MDFKRQMRNYAGLSHGMKIATPDETERPPSNHFGNPVSRIVQLADQYSYPVRASVLSAPSSTWRYCVEMEGSDPDCRDGPYLAGLRCRNVTGP